MKTGFVLIFVLSHYYLIGVNPVIQKNQPETPPPNFLFIITDDLNDSIGGMNGHPQAKTPNMDRLRKMGVTFTNAHCNSPLCAPSRASFLSGYHPHTTGYYAPHNPGKGRFDWKENKILGQSRTLMEHFILNDYTVLGTGKVFHNHHEDWTVWFGKDGKNRFGVAPTWGPWPWDGKKAKGGWGGAVSHPGETESLGIDGNFASLSDIPIVKGNPSNGIPGYKGWRLWKRSFEYQSEDKRDLMPDELNAKWIDEQLKQDFDNPFMMIVGFNRPHSPLYAPQKYFDKFPLEEIQLAICKENDISDTAKIFRSDKMQSSTGLHGFERYDDIIAAGGEQMLKKWTQAYLANVAFVDDMLGQVLDSLEKSGYTENTIIVFTSDHGYHMGQKEIVFKNTLWEESTRVPLIIAGQNISKNIEAEHPVSLIDLFPTFIELAGIDNNPNALTHNLPLDGHSLAPFLYPQPTAEWSGSDYVITSIGVDELNNDGTPQNGNSAHYAIRTKDFRYILYNNDEAELYQLASDPHEWNNLIHHSEFQRVVDSLHELAQKARNN